MVQSVEVAPLLVELWDCVMSLKVNRNPRRKWDDRDQRPRDIPQMVNGRSPADVKQLLDQNITGDDHFRAILREIEAILTRYRGPA